MTTIFFYIDSSSPVPPKTIPSTTTPSQEIPNPTYQTWFQQDQMLLSWLLSSLIEEVFPYVINLSSSFQVWQALSTAFGSVSQNCQLQLNIKLQELKKK